MIEMTETERAKLNERLARAMGIADDRWTFQCLKEDHLLDGHGPHAFCLTCAAPVNKSALVPPDFTRDPAASRELVEWIAKDLNTPYCKKERIKLWNRWWRLLKVMALGYEVDCPTGIENAVILTAPPLLIAIAADTAIAAEAAAPLPDAA